MTGADHPVPDDWWLDFFEGDYQQLFADAIDVDETERAVNDLIALVGIEPGWRVLDAPGGSGRHAVPLAALGCHVTVVDRSPAALATARSVAATTPAGLRVVDADLRRPLVLPPCGPHGPPFDLVANLFNSFGYFADPADDRAMLAGLADVVAEGGWLVMEVAGRAAALAEPSHQDVHVEGATVHAHRHHDPATDRLAITYRVEPDDGTPARTTGTVQRLWSTEALVDLVGGTGLALHGVFGDLDGRPPDAASDWVVVVARRPRTA